MPATNQNNSDAMEEDTSLLPLTPYPGLAAGEAIVKGFRIQSSESAAKASEEAKLAAAPAPSAEGGDHKDQQQQQQQQSSVIAPNTTFVIDEQTVSLLLEALSRQHQALVDNLTELSDVIAAQCAEGVCNLGEAAATLEDTFRRIDVLHAKVEYLNHFVAQPLAAAVKNIRTPKDLKGKALSVLKSFSILKSAADKVSSKEEDAEALWSRIPPFVLINDGAATVPAASHHPSAIGGGNSSVLGGGVEGSDGASAFGSPFPPAGASSASSSASSAAQQPPPFTFGANLGLLQPLTSSFLGGNAAASNAATAEGGGSNNAFFKKQYIAQDVKAGATPPPSSSHHHPQPSTRNPSEFRSEVVAQSVFYFEQSTATRHA